MQGLVEEAKPLLARISSEDRHDTVARAALTLLEREPQ
jgi:hypothetical protein